MREPNANLGSASVLAVVERIVASQKRGTGETDVVDVYGQVLEAIWHRIQPTLGRVTLSAIVERARALTRETHPIIADLGVTPQGIDLEALEPLGEAEAETVQQALQAFVTHMLDILVMLTGDILLRELVHEFDARGEA